jgi:8-oxo-dGTP diphosphatase
MQPGAVARPTVQVGELTSDLFGIESSRHGITLTRRRLGWNRPRRGGHDTVVGMVTRRLVVGAAVLREGRVLAARRDAPSEVAGGWELPGGKVEPGESEQHALARELREELGVGIEVEARLGQPVLIGERYELRIWRARLTAGEPRPLQDHDALRWVGPDELDALPWLPADRQILPALRRALAEAPVDGA